jgi:4-hydroxy-tetrahydrodipicolinate synthase
MQKFIGTGVALITPFKEDLSVDFNALVKLVNFNIENGTNYLVINGTTAESATISGEEKLQIIALIVKTTAGRVANYRFK